MSVTELIRLFAPEFNDVTDNTIEQWAEALKPLVSKKQFGKLYNHALAYLICHKMMIAGLGPAANGGGGMGTFGDAVRFTSYSEGSRSVSFRGGGTSGSVDEELLLTPYGMQFLRLRKLVVVPITSAGVSEGFPLSDAALRMYATPGYIPVGWL